MLKEIAVSFPRYEIDREVLRNLGGDKHPLPSIVSGSQDMPCSRCRMVLAVGPYVRAALESNPNIELMCPLCAAKDSIEAGGETQVRDLGNPESRYETREEIENGD